MKNPIVLDKKHLDAALHDVRICAQWAILEKLREDLYVQYCESLQKIDDQMEALKQEYISIANPVENAREAIAAVMPEEASKYWVPINETEEA